MLRAILGNKSGRISISGESVSVREVYKDREDMLTAAIISRVSYLSDKALTNLFRSIFTKSILDFSKLKEVEFWPNFSSSIQNRVEPDVILHFDWGVMIIEAKRPHDSNQYAEQWIKELESLPLSYREGEIYFLSLGGSAANNTAELVRFEQLKDSYKNISIPFPTFMNYQTWEGLINYLQRSKDSGDLGRSDNYIISDMIEALELYHVHANIHSLSSLKPPNIKHSSLTIITDTKNTTSTIEDGAKYIANLTRLSAQRLSWPASATSFHPRKVSKLTWHVKPLCDINERALELWKI
ncbi:hypothetical protein [Vibrio nigripulchritudo]|uniref:hypothetical protein n=1 Tax=Vibrio nigripulchritudo TaxID=28173 RepID=UPI000A3E2D1B|nr:hypothetical protein [Vibrio nigripulchritudo]